VWFARLFGAQPVDVRRWSYRQLLDATVLVEEVIERHEREQAERG
jgi:hypothetical protein